MKLIEKTCPKCGANLEFEPGAKEVKCSYCNKEFIIEGNENNNMGKEASPDDIQLVSKLGKGVTIMAIVIILVIAFFIIGSVAFGMFNKDSIINKSDNWFSNFNNNYDDDVLKSVKDISVEDQKRIEEKSLTLLKEWNVKSNRVSLNEYKNLGYYLVYDEFGTDIYNVYELNYNVNGVNHVIYTGVSYMNVNYKNKTVKVGNGSIFGKILSYDMCSLWGYESVQDLYNNIDYSDEEISASDGLYTS